MTLFRFPVLVAAATVGVALGACGGSPNGTRNEPAGLPDLEQSLTAHDWLLYVGDSSLTGGVGNPVTLALSGATAVSGTAPCNTYRGAVTLDGGDGVRIGDIATTLMSCEPALEAAERDYLDALAQVRTADISDPERLILTADGVRLSFTAIDPRELIVGDWALTGVRTGAAIQSMVEGAEPIARITADGNLAVETGCNTLRTTWEIDGQAITVEQPAGTLMNCEEPAGVMEQERALVAALTTAATVDVTPAALSLLDDAGDIVLTARRM
ncbi:META domain-containing protein [Blastococcus xanthinilyticus]|uniref:Heat shock protein HslJ n=1 Tax=Blastococcus xanthinilyticus TaxID=1564164 RepID=A0A5S5CL82_9ACTN|nr:META domain-containing protein [Blastococcus xanthinilyticus]TYP81155.1 heat shock protein HslJ [Blastococcus xanthinilyticus]